MRSIYVIIIFFVLSLIGAFVLFKFLKSTAIIKNPKYQAGGALAGFVIIFGLLFGGYSKLEDHDNERLRSEIASLRQKLQTAPIEGEIIPYRKHTKIVLGVKQTDPDNSGQFRLLANCIDPEQDDVKIYVISENKHIVKSIFSKNEMRGIKIRTK